MEEIKRIMFIVAETIDLIGIIIMLFGFGKVLIKYFITEIKSLPKTEINSLQRIRCELGIYILLALDFLIASDIIHTITELDQEQLISLSVMILLRTAIGYFLGKEVNEIEHSQAKT